MIAMTPTGVRDYTDLANDMRPAFEEFARQFTRLTASIDDTGRRIRQALASTDKRGVPFWANNPATAKRPRR